MKGVFTTCPLCRDNMGNDNFRDDTFISDVKVSPKYHVTRTDHLFGNSEFEESTNATGFRGVPVNFNPLAGNLGPQSIFPIPQKQSIFPISNNQNPNNFLAEIAWHRKNR